MLDKHVVPLLKPGLTKLAQKLALKGLTADKVTVVGCALGFACFIALVFSQFFLALILLLLNRLADGLDGEIARAQQPSDAGGFLDITLDFIFYALLPLGFAFADPVSNALPAAVLITSFVGTGASFLAFSSMAQKHDIKAPQFSYKGLYYLDGLAEGTETVIVFVLMCLLPQYFVPLAWFFAFICVITAVNRVVFGYVTLKR